MSSTIRFDRELAKEMQWNLSDIMSTYTDNPNGTDYYNCVFCSRFKYVGSGSDFDHSPTCLGMRMMKELDKRLNEEGE